jgi:GDP-mannose 4,6 dehydratase
MVDATASWSPVEPASSARILQAYTSEVYGDPMVHPQPQSYWGNVNSIGPRSCYDEGKRCAESLFFDYHRQHRLPIKSLGFSMPMALARFLVLGGCLRLSSAWANLDGHVGGPGRLRDPGETYPSNLMRVIPS